MELNTLSQDAFSRVPSLKSLADQDGIDVFVLGPEDDKDLHDFDNPEKCNCMPSIDCLLDEDGLTYAIIVEHRYKQ